MITQSEDPCEALLRSYGMDDEKLIDWMRERFSFRKIKRSGYFQVMGDTHDRMGIVANGIFRFFYLDCKGKERTKHLVTDGGFLLSISSFIEGEPLQFSIQALEDSEIFEMPIGIFRDAVYGSDAVSRIFNEHLLKMYILKERRERSLLMKTPEERYIEFLNENCRLCGVVPQKYIASYLGIDPVSLSRIRARKRTS